MKTVFRGKDKIKRKRKDRVNWEYDTIKELYLSGKSTVEIGKIYNKDYSSINRVLRKLGVDIRKSSEVRRKYSCNSNYFEEIDTEAKAYFLGLLMADGNNNEIGFQITLQERDKHILEKLKDSLEYTGKLYIYNRKNTYKNYQTEVILRITDKQLSNDLSKLGVVPRKTHVADFPCCIPDELIHHFIRGYFDGDGSVGVNKMKQLTFSIIGNILILEKIQNILIKNCNLNKTKLVQNKLHVENIQNLYYTGNTQVLKIADYLYKDATVFLERKKKKIEDFIIWKKELLESKDKSFEKLDVNKNYICSYKKQELEENNFLISCIHRSIRTNKTYRDYFWRIL